MSAKALKTETYVLFPIKNLGGYNSSPKHCHYVIYSSTGIKKISFKIRTEIFDYSKVYFIPKNLVYTDTIIIVNKTTQNKHDELTSLICTAS